MKDKIEYLGYFKYEGAPVAYSYLGAGTFADVYIGDFGPSVSLEDGPVVSVILGQQL